MAQPTAYEQYFLELVNRARANPGAEAARLGIDLNQDLSSGTISDTAKQPLAMNQLLNDSAQSHSDWMLATDTFSHTGANGSSAGDRIKAAGYAFSGSWTWGENISIRWGGSTSESSTLVNSFHDGLFKSAGHRKNILNDAFKEIGIGIGLGEYQGSNAGDATQNFARSGSAVFLTGVAFDDKDGDRFYDPGEGLGKVNVSIKSSGGAPYQATTWDAGGYQLALPAGDYTVTFSGGGLAAPVAKSAKIGSANVKLDLDADAGAGAGPTPTPTPTPSGNPANIVVGAGPDALVLRVSQDAYNGSAQYTVSVDGKQIGGVLTAGALHGSGQSDTVTVKGDWAAGQHSFEVRFLNDDWGGTAATDRNLYLDGASYNGQVVAGAARDPLSNGPAGFSFTEAATAPGGNLDLQGTSGADRLTGGTGADRLRGLAGDDALSGDAGYDALLGGNGADRLVGGAGGDVLIGGAGRDAFVFASAADGNDRIQDFARADGDKIDLSAIDADARTAGDQAFLFADGIAFVAYQPGTVRTSRGSDGTITVEADTGAGVLSFRVQGAASLAADDFLL